MLCAVISAVEKFMVKVLHSRLLLNPAMLCDVISAVAKFMVKVLHSRLLLNPTLVGFRASVRVRVANSMPLGCPCTYRLSP
jgi:hypothetical protein